jgi:class 3 adenylate cyclase
MPIHNRRRLGRCAVVARQAAVWLGTASLLSAPSAFEGRFDYAAIGTVSNVASRLCDEAKPGQILISPRVLTKVENAVKVGIRRPLAAYNVVAALA